MRTKYNVFGTGLKLKIAIVVSCQCAFVLFGYDQGVFSGIVTNSNWKETFGHPGSSLEGIIVSIYNLGAFSGTILAFAFAERLGRRWCMWIAMLWIIVGAALQCTSYTQAQLLVARYVTGIGTGIETSTVPIYQSELCDPDVRGRLVSSEPLFVGVGIVIAYFFDYGMSHVAGSTAWRVPIAAQTFFCFLVIFLVFGLPESPRWLYYHGREEEALEVLCDVWDATPEDPRVHKMHTEITEAIALERRTGEYKWRQLFHRDEVQTGRRVLLAYGMQFMNQMGGINMLMWVLSVLLSLIQLTFESYFVPSALQENVGLSPNSAQLIGGGIQCMFIVGSIFPTFLLDKYGRRRPMMWGSLGTGWCMMMISILLSFKSKSGQYSEEVGTKTSEAAVAFFFLYMIFFGATANCIPWVYVVSQTWILQRDWVLTVTSAGDPAIARAKQRHGHRYQCQLAVELCRRHGQPVGHQQPALASLPHLDVSEFLLHTTSFLLVSKIVA